MTTTIYTILIIAVIAAAIIATIIAYACLIIKGRIDQAEDEAHPYHPDKDLVTNDEEGNWH